MRALSLFALLLSASLQAEVLFTDSFDGSAVDPNKWNTVLPFGDSSVTQSNGSLVQKNRGIAFINQSFNGPYELTGSFVKHTSYGIFGITLRSDGSLSSSDHYYEPNGLSIFFWGPANRPTPNDQGLGWVDIRGAVHGVYEWGNNVALADEQEHFFKITDYGTNIRIELDGTLLVDYQTSFSLGGQIGFDNSPSRDNFGSGPARWEGNTEIKSVQVSTVVPEPSSVSLMALGAVVVVALGNIRKKH